MDSRGQISLEAVLVIGVFMLLVVSVFNLWVGRIALARDVGEAGEARMLGELLAETINNAYANGGNFSITLTEEEINFTRLGDTTSMEGGGLNLPITINTSARAIDISKNMSKTGGRAWKTSVFILPANITRAEPTQAYPEVTVRNNGSYIIIYASASHIEVVP